MKRRYVRNTRTLRLWRCRCAHCRMTRDVLAAGGSVESDGTFTVDADWFRANFTPVAE